MIFYIMGNILSDNTSNDYDGSNDPGVDSVRKIYNYFKKLKKS